jgi:hypothetical protein
MAAQCLAIAKQTADPGIRASLVQMAQRWLELAELSERAGFKKLYVSAPLTLRSDKSFARYLSCRGTCRAVF